jgi:hypothetical protein
MIPMEMPNRRIPVPPPFVYHPELYPELAENNPEPTNFTIPRTRAKSEKVALQSANYKLQKNNKTKNVGRGFSVVKAGEEDRFVMPMFIEDHIHEEYRNY